MALSSAGQIVGGLALGFSGTMGVSVFTEGLFDAFSLIKALYRRRGGISVSQYLKSKAISYAITLTTTLVQKIARMAKASTQLAKTASTTTTTTTAFVTEGI